MSMKKRVHSYWLELWATNNVFCLETKRDNPTTQKLLYASSQETFLGACRLKI